MTTEIARLGVEEEYQLVDTNSGCLIPQCKEVMRTLRQRDLKSGLHAEIQHELHLNQIEMASGVCTSLDEVHEVLCKTRQRLSTAARENGCALVAAGTNPMAVPDDPALTPKERYWSMTDQFQQIARELFIFGCHVHVSMDDRALGVRVMNRSRRWLPLLQALTANSPFWDGQDTGYASYRRELWAPWPMAGPPPHFDDVDDYQGCVEQLLQCGAISDESFIYWDIRLPTKVPTIEFRGADVMTRVEETVAYAGLVRGIVSASRNGEDTRYPVVRSSVLRHALWQGARYGLSGELVDPATAECLSPRDLADRLLNQIEGALNTAGDRERVEQFIDRVLSGGTGAVRQRRAAEDTGGLKPTVKMLADETAMT